MPNTISPEQTAKPASRNSKKEDQYFSRSVSKAFEVLAILAGSHDALSVNDVADRVGLTKSFAFRLLRTLESLHHLSRSADGRFMIAHGNYAASTQIAARLRAVALDQMRDLNRRYQETVSLAVLFENRIEVIEVLDSPHLMRMTNIVGRILPPHASSLGKTIVAFQPEADQERLIRNYGLLQITTHTIIDEDLLAQEFERIRQLGYGSDDEESILGAHCVGAPIRLGYSVIGAVSLSMPKSRMPKSDAGFGLVIDTVRATADAITAALNMG